MKKLLALLLLALSVASASAQTQGPQFRPSAHITSATTTTILAAATGQKISIQGGSICVDGNGVTTAVTIQDGAGTNLVGTGVVYVLLAGQCLVFPRVQDLYYVPTASGQSLQIITSAAGPTEVYLELVQR